MKRILLAVIIATGIAACSKDEAIVGFGEPDCAQWIKEPTIARQAWLLGYLSGWNAVFYNGLDQITSHQALLWMNNYCGRNPLDKLGKGGAALSNALSERRKPK